MGRLMGLDVGQQRTGIATTDALHIACSPHMTVQTSRLIDTLRDMLKGSDFEGIVIGRPHLIGGGTTDSIPHIDDVADKIRKAWPGMAIHFVDEASLPRKHPPSRSRRHEKVQTERKAAWTPSLPA